MTDIKILSGRYKRHKLVGLQLFKKNKPCKINKIDSKGKFLWFDMTDKNDNKLYILNRFGLEGEWGFEKQKHSGVSFVIKKGDIEQTIYFTDSRSFGTISITNKDHLLRVELEKLAPDFLKTSFTNAEFHNRIGKFIENSVARKNKPIIKILMDQQAIGSGLGNYLAPEALYQAKISPHTKLVDIYNNRKLSNALARAIKYVTKMVYLKGDIGYLEHLEKGMSKFITKLRNDIAKNHTSPLNFHPEIKLKPTAKFVFKIYRQEKDPKGNPVKADKIIPGRTTYWVPAIQK